MSTTLICIPLAKSADLLSLFREPARSYANGFGLRKNETASRLKSKKKLSLMALPLFLEEHKPDIERLFAKTADIVRAP